MNRFLLALLMFALVACDKAPQQPVPPTAPAAPPAAEVVAPPPAMPIATNTTATITAADSDTNMQVLLTPADSPAKTNHTVVAGDTLGKLAKQYNTTIELIQKSNNLKSDIIRLGQRLRIHRGEFAVTVSKSANTLTLTDRGQPFKTYRVGTGQHAKTPVGDFKITNRLANPPWYRPDGPVVPFGDPANILGTHWLGLDVPGYGLHGTWETNSIGKQSSAGCVRLVNDDVTELYILLPTGTPVTIHD
jgi:lipoprotein-anchoring transpeptidase ErfK/SrfK